MEGTASQNQTDQNENQESNDQQNTYENFGKFKTISHTQYNPQNQSGQNSFRGEGSNSREVNSQLERTRYKGNNKKKHYRKFGNKTIQNGGSDTATLSPYIPAASVYGVQNPSNRRANRHFFGMGNNIIVGGNIPYNHYAPSDQDQMNNTHNGFKQQYNPEPNAGPQRSRYFDEKSNGTAEKNARFNTQDSTAKDDKSENVHLEPSQNAKSLDKLDKRIQGGVGDSQKFSINLGEINRRSTGIFDGQHQISNILDATGRTGTQLNASDVLTQLSKQLSQMTVDAIEEIQGRNPSKKFQAKLIEKEKEMERAMVENRVKKLEFEEKRAQQKLAKTMHTHWVCDQVQARRQNDFDEKQAWLNWKNEELRRQRDLNTRLREERKSNIARQRQRVIMENIMSRDQQLQEMNSQNQDYNREATKKFMEVSQQTANIYRMKMEAKQRQLNCFQGRLFHVRTSCEHDATNSIMMSEHHNNRIRQLEMFEKQILNNLQGTMKTTSALVANLAQKSEALTNTLMPRSPIVPKNKKYPKHSQFGFSIDDQSFKKRFDSLLSSSPGNSRQVGNRLSNNSQARRSINNSVNYNERNAGYPMFQSGSNGKSKNLPFHSKRATVDELHLKQKLNPIMKTIPAASENNNAYGDGTATNEDNENDGSNQPNLQPSLNVTQGNPETTNQEQSAEWTGRKQSVV